MTKGWFNMGLLPSQKYDMILWDFCNWLIEDTGRISQIINGDYEKTITNFLNQIDTKQWENKNTKSYELDLPFFNKQ